MNWVIRPAVATDAAALSELAERTFREAFSALNTAENMELHCTNSFSPAIQAVEIADSTILTVVAEANGTLSAFAQLHLRAETPTCVPVSPSAELRRIYVDRNLHGSGLARQLLACVLEAGADSGAKSVWLGVWEHNPRAIRFYQSAGFSEVGDHVFTVGTDPQRDLLMARNLTD
ncbi:MAG TPA: GNAT family N-acetyltransferase [Gemmatimonadaceae bacterium]|nr:GNAT family N-acetyltransferase [Gemmatimonadaceae bacterium]